MLCVLVMQMEKQGQEANIVDKKKKPGEGLEQGFTGTCNVGRKPRKQAVFDQNPQQPSPPLPTQRGQCPQFLGQAWVSGSFLTLFWWLHRNTLNTHRSIKPLTNFSFALLCQQKNICIDQRTILQSVVLGELIDISWKKRVGQLNEFRKKKKNSVKQS